MVPQSSPPFGVLPPQENVLQQTSKGQEEDEVADDDTVTDTVLGLV